VTTAPQSQLSNQVQRLAADISARLAQIAKEPPDLGAYLRLHAEVVLQALQPVGFCYEMATGQNFQRAFAYNHDSLNLRDSPAQELAFQRAVRKTAETGQPLFLDANTLPVDAPHGLTAEDAPAPETLSLHNQTPYQHAFVAIPLAKKAVGVIHAWFTPGDSAAANARVAVLAHCAAEIELYLKARRISDISQELSRINTYARFLEDAAGDQNLDSVAWKLVNYAREAVGCDRVCLLVDSKYGVAVKGLTRPQEFELQACSGLRRPHPRSEHAEVLKAHTSELLKLAVGGPTPAEAAAPAAPATVPNPETPPPAKEGKTESKPAEPKAPTETRPRMRIIFTIRDPAKTATRPEAVNRYFDVIPMNWSTVLPLYDRENRVCGTLLFEGQQSSDKVAPLFTQMRDLAVSGGRVLSTALVWHRRRALRGARTVMRWRDALIGASRRRLALKYGLPLIATIALLAFPFPYRIRGDATMRPVKVQSVAALTPGRLIEINAREGAHVKKGQILCVLDSTDLQLQRLQAQQDKARAETESLQAARDHKEAQRQIAQLTAEKLQLLIDKISNDIDLTVIRAPFDGILAGPQDLTQRRGQVIRTGEIVAEILDPTHWEVKISVREQDVPTLTGELEQRRTGDPKASIAGELVLAANPNRTYALTLIDPAAFAHRLDAGGGNYNFSAILPLHDAIADPTTIGPGGEIKTGYTGRARFDCGRRPLARILFGDFVRFVKVNFF
jgi:hypothetical protein